MAPEIKKALEELRQSGWTVEMQTERQTLNANLLHRYNWIPTEVTDFICEVKQVVTPADEAWFLTSDNFNGTSKTNVWTWNTWENLSLDSARQSKDEKWATEIRAYWDNHFPIFFSVKSGYSYFGLAKDTLHIVEGYEAQMEDPTFLTDSFSDLFKFLTSQDTRLGIWI